MSGVRWLVFSSSSQELVTLELLCDCKSAAQLTQPSHRQPGAVSSVGLGGGRQAPCSRTSCHGPSSLGPLPSSLSYRCCGLNVCVPPDSEVEALTSSVMVLGRAFGTR